MLDALLLFLAPILLQQWGFSPFWLLATAFVWNLYCRRPALRKIDEARVAEFHSERAGYLVWVKPWFVGTWLSAAVYAASYAVDRWLI